ncbi:MAG: hypothetical protein MJ102_08475 [Clostridia bacterium]|nr:hypothetical protein [Clostridia bacterium]
MNTDDNYTSSSVNTSKDITGLRSGMAVAIEKTDRKRKGVTLWRCRCDCGKEFYTEAGKIRSGKVQSCGCLRNIKRIKDISGQKYGKLTAIRRLDEKSGTSFLWLCRCDCGNEIKESVGNLTSGQVISCGCAKAEAGKRSIKDISGQRFGKLIVIEPTDKRADGGSVVWKCHCDCGNDTEVSCNRLRKGKVRSCGCLSNPPLKDYIGKRFGRLTVIGYAGKLNTNSTEHYWTCRCDCGNETNVGQNELQNGDTVSCGCYQIERMLESLRLIDNTSVTILERSKKPRVNNKSGYPGVFQEKSGKWIAYISFKKKRYWLGRYDDKDDAIRARLRGEEMHDDFLEWYYAEYERKSQKKRA